jgi:hypothetical protein
MRIILVVFLLPLVSMAQHAVIRGVAPLAIGEEIQLRVYDDPISGKERVLASQKIDVDGSFELKVVPNGSAQYAFLQVGTDCADFFIQRDKDVELSFVPPKEDPNKAKAFYQRQFFIPKITGGGGKKLNEQIIAFNDTLDEFLASIYPYLKQRKSPGFVAKRVQAFEQMALKDYASAEPFVREYVKCSIASVEQTFLSDRDRLFEKYLKDVNPIFENPAYVDFVLQFFEYTVGNVIIVPRLKECKEAFNSVEAFATLDEMLREGEPYLENSSLSRLILIQEFDALFAHNDFDDEKLVAALRHFGMLSSNSYLGNAARNIADKHAALRKGTAAPDIIFVDANGSEKKLSELFGNYIFLELTDATNVYSNRETNVIPNLKDEFKFVRFVTICVGNSESDMLSLKKKMSIDWELGRITLPSPTLDDYRIKSLPLFFIIDPDGNFYAAPAKDPTTGAQQELMSLNEKLKAKNRQGVGK